MSKWLFLLIFLLVPMASAADFAYIVKSSGGVDDFLVGEFESLGHSIDNVFESEVGSTDFGQYDGIIIGDQNLREPGDVPIEKHRTFFINSWDYVQAGLSTSKSAKSSPTSLEVVGTSEIVSGVPSSFFGYTRNELSAKTYLLKGRKPSGFDSIIGSGSSLDPVVATFSIEDELLDGKVLEQKLVFFGVVKAEFWSGETRKVFANSLSWLLEGGSVVISPVEKNAVISSFSPLQTRVNVLDGKTRSFSVIVDDDDGIFDVDWFLDGASLNHNSRSYLFDKRLGSYILKVVVADEGATNSVEWRVDVGVAGEVQCSDVNGFLCSEGAVCFGNLHDTVGGNCCSTACVSNAFRDVGACSEIESSLKLDLVDPDESDEFELGDNLRARVEIENEVNEDLDLDIEVHFYNLDEDDSLLEETRNVDLNENERDVFSFDFEIPEDIDLSDRFLVFAKAEDAGFCNQDFVELDLNRKDNRVIATAISLPSSIECGDSVNAEVNVHNVGLEDEKVTVILKNLRLRIDEESEEFELEEFDDDNDEEDVEFNFEIPADVEPGDYDLEATVKFSLNRISTFTRTLKVTCGDEEPAQVQDEFVEEPEQLGNVGLDSVAGDEVRNSRSILLPLLMFSTTIIIFSFGGLLYWGYYLKKRK